MKYLPIALALALAAPAIAHATPWRLAIVTVTASETGPVVSKTFYAHPNGGECNAQLDGLKIAAGAGVSISAVCEKPE